MCTVYALDQLVTMSVTDMTVGVVVDDNDIYKRKFSLVHGAGLFTFRHELKKNVEYIHSCNGVCLQHVTVYVSAYVCSIHRNHIRY